MRVVVNQTPALGLKTGVGHYVAQLLRCLGRQDSGDEVVGFPDGWLGRAKKTWDRARSCLERRSRSDGSERASSASGSPRLLSRRGMLDCCRRNGRVLLGKMFHARFAPGTCDLYHEPNFIPLPSGLPTVTTIHDLSVLLHPEWHPADRVKYFERYFREGLSRTAHVIAISEFGRQEIIRELHVAPGRVTRTYMGVRAGLRPLPAATTAGALQRLGLPARYLLYLGTIEPRKNVLTILRAYCALPASVRDSCPLLLIGSWGWRSEEVGRFLEDEARHRGVIHRGYLADADLAAVYNGARALLFPSLYEGFGLPPVEMSGCGGAVIASTAGAVVETVGRQAHLVDPLDLDGWIAALSRVVRDDDWHAALRRGAVETARAFTWERCAADTWDVYRHVAGSPQRIAA